jgi:hypothetical protein
MMKMKKTTTMLVGGLVSTRAAHCLIFIASAEAQVLFRAAANATS